MSRWSPVWNDGSSPTISPSNSFAVPASDLASIDSVFPRSTFASSIHLSFESCTVTRAMSGWLSDESTMTRSWSAMSSSFRSPSIVR